MLIDAYSGETVRVTAKDLTHSDEGAVIAGATVTIALYNPDGTLNTNGTIANDGDDWYADLAMPATLGQYTVKLTAAKSGATWKGIGYIRVKGF